MFFNLLSRVMFFDHAIFEGGHAATINFPRSGQLLGTFFLESQTSYRPLRSLNTVCARSTICAADVN